VKVHLLSEQDYQRRIIWNVIGKIKGSQYPDDWVVPAIIATHGSLAQSIHPAAPRHAEAVHGIGALLRQGWRPKRTLIFASWTRKKKA